MTGFQSRRKMLTTTYIRELLRIAEKYNYEGAVDWMLPHTSAKTFYESQLHNRAYADELADLISLDEEPEIKDHRLALFDLAKEFEEKIAELKKQARQIEADAEPEVPEWKRKQTPESRKLWDKISQLSPYELRDRAVCRPIPITSFVEIGKAIKIGLRTLGPINYFSVSTTLKGTKVLGWRVETFDAVEKILYARQEFLKERIRKFYIFGENILRLGIRIPEEIDPVVFYNSNDPKVWKELQTKKTNRRKVKAVTTRLDREND